MPPDGGSPSASAAGGDSGSTEPVTPAPTPPPFGAPPIDPAPPAPAPSPIAFGGQAYGPPPGQAPPAGFGPRRGPPPGRTGGFARLRRRPATGYPAPPVQAATAAHRSRHGLPRCRCSAPAARCHPGSRRPSPMRLAAATEHGTARRKKSAWIRAVLVAIVILLALLGGGGARPDQARGQDQRQRPQGRSVHQRRPGRGQDGQGHQLLEAAPGPDRGHDGQGHRLPPPSAPSARLDAAELRPHRAQDPAGSSPQSCPSRTCRPETSSTTCASPSTRPAPTSPVRSRADCPRRFHR